MKITKSLIGRRFYRLTVIAPADPDKDGAKQWLCKCDCGNEKVIHQQSLCRGSTKSCGCYKAETSRKRMPRGWGKIFTKEFLETEHIEKKRSLRQIAKEAGCTIGCIRRYMKKHKLEANDIFHNIAGQKFEMLTAISFAHSKCGSSYWNVRCDCGVEKTVQTTALVRHKIVSCGCWNRNKNWQGCGDLSKKYWTRTIQSAKKRNISFEITMNYAWDLFQKQNGKCAISNKDIVMDRNLSWNYCKGEHKQTASLDRIDPTQGYCVGNVQWVHVVLNKMKSDMSQSDFIEWCKCVTKNNC
jgi:hypothetical protein